MDISNFQSIGIVTISALAVLLAITLFRRPIGFLIRLLFNTLGGFVALFLLNFFGQFIGVTLGLNWFNAVIVGIFGLPGVGLLLIMQWLLII